MTVDPTLLAELGQFLRAVPDVARAVLGRLCESDPLVSRGRIQDVLRGLVEEQPELAKTALARMLDHAQLAVVSDAWIGFAIRRRIGRWGFLRVHAETHEVEELSVRDFLRFKERMVGQADEGHDFPLEIDLGPFGRGLPRMQETGSIGRGAEYLNRRLSGQLFQDLELGARTLLEFLRSHKHDGKQLLIGPELDDLQDLRRALRTGIQRLAGQPGETRWSEFETDLAALGLYVGWGDDAARSSETMGLLLELLEAPSPDLLETFLGRIPMIFSVAIVSPHGWFGQSGVLGRPDTGGQIVYILDQVRALEHEMRERLQRQGLYTDPQIVVLTRLIPEADGTKCDQRIERIEGTQHARILRVPFRDGEGRTLQQWVSRFEIWPYLERYAFDAGPELVDELGSPPDLVIGNYSDGNLVAALLATRLKVTLVTIAHALEKAKYPNSDLQWRELDDQYHFSSQFTADLISMNAADLILTSSRQEISGTEESLGQYESYSFFTMPGLYRVVEGVDVYDPKFNIVSPGADPELYFPSSENGRRRVDLHGEIRELVYGDGAGSEHRGRFRDEGKPLLFTMARMDKVKNITGLAEWFGRSEALRSEVNLFVASGYLDPGKSKDVEERAEIERMHAILDRYDLEGELRWVEGQASPERNGELYRFVSDSGGAFVQPATFEAFGLTVIEAMSTGLPTFATCHGGPLEIIEDGLSGFHIDPSHGDEAAAKMASFFASCREDPGAWRAISAGALARVEAHYTWKGYAERLMTLARLYGFWRHATNLERTEARRYLEMLYALQLRPLARAMAE